MPKPLVDRLEGIAPVGGHRAAESHRLAAGRPSARPPRSTTTCGCSGPGSAGATAASCGAPVRRDTPQSAADDVAGRRAGRRGSRSPFRSRRSARLTHDAVVENLRALGFVRVLADGVPHHLDELPPRLDLTQAGGAAGRGGSAGSRAGGGRAGWPRRSATAFQEGEGRGGRAARRRAGSGSPSFPACSACDTPAAPVTPGLFSFNNPRGACADCNGFGAVLEYDESLIVPDPARSLADGAIDPWTKPRYEARRRLLLDVRARASAPTRPSPGTSSRRRTGASCSTARRAATSGSSPSSRASRRSATSSTSGSSCGSTSSRRPARPAAAPGSTRTRCAVRIGGDTIADVAARSVDGIARTGCRRCR